MYFKLSLGYTYADHRNQVRKIMKVVQDIYVSFGENKKNHILKINDLKFECMPIGCGFYSTLWDEEENKDPSFSLIGVANYACLGERSWTMSMDNVGLQICHLGTSNFMAL